MPSVHRPLSPRRRCDWARTELSIRYHDEEWGVPLHDDRKLFELLILEGAQAGLSWETILKKRDHYRAAFDGFDPAIVAGYGKRKVHELLANPGIVRNRLKIASAIRNAKAFLAVQRSSAPSTPTFGDSSARSPSGTDGVRSRTPPIGPPNPMP